MANETYERVRSTLDTLPQAIGEQMESYEHRPIADSEFSKALDSSPEPEAIKSIYSLAMLAITAAADHMRGLERGLQEPVMTFAPWAIARAVLESSSLAAWLLENGINNNMRLSRSMSLRLRHLFDEAIYAKSMLNEEPEISRYFRQVEPHVNSRIDSLRSQAVELGISEKLDRSKRLIGFGNGMPSLTDLAELAFQEGSTYRLFSAVSHNRTWASLALSMTRDNNISSISQNLTVDSAMFLVTSAIDWFSRSAWSYFELHGWNTDLLATALEAQYDQAAMVQDIRFWRNL